MNLRFIVCLRPLQIRKELHNKQTTTVPFRSVISRDLFEGARHVADRYVQIMMLLLPRQTPPGSRSRSSASSKPCGMPQCDAVRALLLAAVLLLGGRSVPTGATQREVRDSEGLKSAILDQEVADIVLLESIVVREAEWGDAPVVTRDLAFIGKGAPGFRKKLILEKELKEFVM